VTHSPAKRPAHRGERSASEILPRSFHSRAAVGIRRVSGRPGAALGALRRVASVLVAAVLLVLVTGCGSPVTIKAAYDPTAPFQQYQTFAMIEPNRPIPTGMDSDPFTLRKLRELTYHALVAHGLRPVAADQADLLVGVLARFQTQVEVSSTGGPYTGPYDYRYYGYGPRYGGPWGGFGTTFGPTVTKYDEMQVAIDLIDPGKNEVRWRGYGARRANKNLTSEQLEEMVVRILSQYPPGAGQDSAGSAK